MNNEDKKARKLLIDGIVNVIGFFFIQGFLIYARYKWFDVCPLWPFLIPLMLVSLIIVIVIFKVIRDENY